MRINPTINQSWTQIRTESCKGNMGRYYETSLFLPLPIRWLSIWWISTITLDLIILLLVWTLLLLMKGCQEAVHPVPIIWLVDESVCSLVYSLDPSLIAKERSPVAPQTWKEPPLQFNPLLSMLNEYFKMQSVLLVCLSKELGLINFQNVWLLARHLAIQMQRERASIPKVRLLGCFSLVKERKEP